MAALGRKGTMAEALSAVARPLAGAPADFDPLLEKVGDARLVLLGEASHGTHEFYRMRAEITKRLVCEKGFRGVAVEADWPDAYRINRYVRGRGSDTQAVDALGGFKRFPQWMWRNADVLDFINWLRAHNDTLQAADRIGFYGLDLYSLHASIEAVLRYLRVVDPEAAKRAQQRYACFERFGDDPQSYGYAASIGLSRSCEREVVSQLIELRRSAATYTDRGGPLAPDDLFFAQENARVVRNAERYYRAMFGSHIDSWNLRDRHMAETLETLSAFLDEQPSGAKLVVWAHNSHLGDARATEMGSGGELNVGQLMRERHGRDTLLVGFTTYTGTVTAASDWDEPAERKVVRPALPGSYEALFHDSHPGNFLVDLQGLALAAPPLKQPLLERAIGVIYRPESERQSHYFQAILHQQFDVVLHYDTTHAVQPLEHAPISEQGEVPETYPTTL